MQKYLEYLVRITESGSANFGGGVGLVSAIGLLASGLILSKVRLNIRSITGWNVVIMILILAWRITFGSIGYPTTDLYGEITFTGINNIMRYNNQLL